MAGALALALTLGGCSSSENAAEDVREEVSEAMPEVDWSQHMPDLQRLIDKAAKRGDCKQLQETFDAQADRNGVDPDLLDYIDAQLQEADCY